MPSPPVVLSLLALSVAASPPQPPANPRAAVAIAIIVFFSAEFISTSKIVYPSTNTDEWDNPKEPMYRTLHERSAPEKSETCLNG